MLLTFITRISFCEDVRFRFWTLFDTQLKNFIRKYCLLFILDFKIRTLKTYLQYKFTVQRVNEASFFEVTTSRSCEDVSVFHNVTFGPGGKAIIYFCSVFSVRFLVSTFESFLGFREFFPRLSAIFFKRAREPEIKLRHVVYEVWLVSYLFFSFQIIMVLSKMNNHEHRTKQTYESYTFQPLMSFC